jgi:hypothetical protein
MVKPLVGGWEDPRRDLFIAVKEQLAQGKERHFPIMDTHLINRWGGDRRREDQSHAEPREGARSQANIFVMCRCVWS